jgi:glycosyltransferase involved in cell wall biosynthesis
MRVSVIICTKNRVQELVDCIKSVIGQSVAATEIVVVDASDTDRAYLKIKEEFSQDSRIRYVHSVPPSSLSADRNTGVRYSSGDVFLFLDDDTVLDKDFVKEIVRVFEDDSARKVGGVTGNIVNAERPGTTLMKLRADLQLVIARIFLLPSLGDGKFRASAAPTFLYDAHEIRNVEFLSGCDMAFRREVFSVFKFDEDFPELYKDDDDFSYRVSRRYQNVYTPYAKLVHNLSPTGSASARLAHTYLRTKKTVQSRYYLLKKNYPRTLKNTLAFWWSVVGSLLQALMTMDSENIKGMISGISGIREISYRLTSRNNYSKR